jgi:archaellum biogenesis ATPase FlaH
VLLEKMAKNMIGGTTLIEEDLRSVSSILSRQLASSALLAGKKVCYLTTGDKEDVVAGSKLFKFNLDACVQELRDGVLKGSLKTQEDLRAADVIVIDSFSAYVFDKDEKETIELIREMGRAAREGKTFVLTYEPKMLSPELDAYVKSAVDNIISIKTEIQGNKISRMLYIPKMKSSKPQDKLIKFTVEDNGIQVDTREMIG